MKYQMHVMEMAERKDEFKAEIAHILVQALIEGEAFAKSQHQARPTKTAEDKVKVAMLAELVAAARNDPGAESVAGTSEIASRITQQLMNMGDSHAMLGLRMFWTEDEHRLVKRVAEDTIPWARMAALRTLRSGEWVPHESVRRAMRLGHEKASIVMAHMEASGLVEKNQSRTSVTQTTEYRIAPEEHEEMSVLGFAGAGSVTTDGLCDESARSL